jgi:predicted enzyme related to lactoylglutathione lyase
LPKVGGGRHVDFERRWSRVLAEVDRLTAAGATVIAQVDFNGRGNHLIMTDPEGNEFCVV